jgi:hypothetical protein
MEGGRRGGEEEESVPFKDFLPTCDGEGEEGVVRRKGVLPLRIFCPPVMGGGGEKGVERRK